MFGIVFGTGIRILSNSFLNALQKKLTLREEIPSVVNFYTYLGLTVLCMPFIHQINFSIEFIINVLIMGLLGALGNTAIIKALSCGEMSTLAPINSYKPVIALIFGIFLLKEIPGIHAILGIILILLGTFILIDRHNFQSRALFYRFGALIFSGTEAIFIKKVILLSDITTALVFWAISGMLFSFILALRHSLKISKQSVKYQLALIVSVGIMQLSTNYVFSKIDVACALALFQLSTILSVFIGVNMFNEKGLVRKLAASSIMVAGAVIILLN